MRSRRSALLLVVLAASLVGCYGELPTGNIAFESDYKAGLERAVQQDKPIMLFFTADW